MTRKKNDLSQFQGGHTNQLEKAEKARDGNLKKPRQLKDPEKKVSCRVALNLTPDQLDTVKTKAGLAPVSTFIVNFLDGKGFFEK